MKLPRSQQLRPRGPDPCGKGWLDARDKNGKLHTNSTGTFREITGAPWEQLRFFHPAKKECSHHGFKGDTLYKSIIFSRKGTSIAGIACRYISAHPPIKYHWLGEHPLHTQYPSINIANELNYS